MLRRYLVPPLVTCLCFLIGCKNKIETATPTVENITESVYASGRVKSRNQYSVFATVSSTLEEILVREGEKVKAGQPIARLKNNTAKLANDNAKIALRYAQLSENKEKLHEQRIAVQLAKEKLLTDSLLMVRQDNLRKQNIGSQVEWEQRKLAYESSAAAHHSASIRYHELERQLKLAANQAQISYEVATQQLMERSTHG
jgi:HlyD family secretion protein